MTLLSLLSPPSPHPAVLNIVLDKGPGTFLLIGKHIGLIFLDNAKAVFNLIIA